MNSVRIEIEDQKGLVLPYIYEVHSIEKALEIINATIPLTLDHGSRIVGVQVA